MDKVDQGTIAEPSHDWQEYPAAEALCVGLVAKRTTEGVIRMPNSITTAHAPKK